jgi:hypothetical protein
MGGGIVWRLGDFGGESGRRAMESIALFLLDWPIDDGESQNLSVDRRAGRQISNFPSIDPS